jgi:hypothetical protein
MFHGKIHYKCPFSIAMLVYQRVIEANGVSWRYIRDMLGISPTISRNV